MATLLPTWVDSHFATSGTEENLLIGFSKSGYGALDLLFKHPDVFDAVAAWDFPADMAAYTDYGASANYGTDTNFQNNYRLTGTFIDTWEAPFTTENRIWISEGDIFPTQVADFDALLTSQGVLHTFLTTQTDDAHNWYGGWLSDAVAGLYGLVDTTPADTTPPAAPTTPDLIAASDSGASNTDNITNVTTPTFTCTAEAGSLVKLFDGATQIGSATAHGSGNWSITSSTLKIGRATCRETATNTGGDRAVKSDA